MFALMHVSFDFSLSGKIFVNNRVDTVIVELYTDAVDRFRAAMEARKQVCLCVCVYSCVFPSCHEGACVCVCVRLCGRVCARPAVAQ